MKFVCHDKHDSSTFAAVLQLPTPDSDEMGYKLYCFQAEAKTVSL
jgi:hypothetical protein